VAGDVERLGWKRLRRDVERVEHSRGALRGDRVDDDGELASLPEVDEEGGASATRHEVDALRRPSAQSFDDRDPRPVVGPERIPDPSDEHWSERLSRCSLLGPHSRSMSTRRK
jgi:hypothetical protein